MRALSATRLLCCLGRQGGVGWGGGDSFHTPTSTKHKNKTQTTTTNNNNNKQIKLWLALFSTALGVGVILWALDTAVKSMDYDISEGDAVDDCPICRCKRCGAAKQPPSPPGGKDGNGDDDVEGGRRTECAASVAAAAAAAVRRKAPATAMSRFVDALERAHGSDAVKGLATLGAFVAVRLRVRRGAGRVLT
jgi:hypothetical protein